MNPQDPIPYAPNPHQDNPRWPAWLPAVVIALVSVAVFWPSLQGEFLNWDDELYLTGHDNYRGLDWQHIRWMFTTTHGGPYQPLGWLSWALDYRLWGLNAKGFKLSNLLLHAMTAGLLYLLALRLLRPGLTLEASRPSPALQLGACAAALLFALHPLRAESVAWATERRDVLSGLFYVLSVLLYVRWCQRRVVPSTGRASGWPAGAFVAFLCALLSKGMSVSLPFVLLILDVYPLRRVRVSFAPDSPLIAGRLSRVIVEKIPFLLCSAAIAVLAVHGVREVGALNPLQDISVVERVVLSTYSSWFYLLKTIWPAHLSPLYEYPVKLDILHWPYLLSVVVFVAICLLAWRLRAARPGVGAAWLSYLMILAPVSGLIHAGPQLVADRYTYLATMGLAVLAGGGLVHLWARLRGRTRRTCLVAAALSVAGLLGVMTRNQLHIWQNSAALWEHVHRLHPDSWHANNNLGILRAREGRTQEAETLYGHAVRVKPDYANGYHNLAVLLDSVGREDEAIANFETALQIDPAYPKAYACLGNIYLKRGDLSTAAEMYRLGQQYAPDDPVILSNLGNVLTRLGTLEQAIPLLQRAIGIAPDLLQAHYNLGLAWENAGRAEQALTEYRRCAELDPDHSPSAKSMGDLLVSLGRFHEAIEPLQRVARLNPSDVQTQTNLGYVMILASRYAAASRILAAAHQQDPNHLPTILALANLQAASPVDSVRDGPNAVRLATLACERTNHANARALDILAAAHAETKRFDLAVSAAREALQIARVAGDTRTADQIEARLRLYLASTPYRLPARAEP